MPLAILITVIFALASMLMGGMLVIGQTGMRGTTVLILTGGTAPWWNYPGVLVLFPNATLALPFFATITMVIVAIGVGLGLTVATVLWVRLIHQRRLQRQAAGSAAIGSMAGLTPAFLALATIGACCSITASTAAGLGVVAQAAGANAYDLLANNWYLGVFQMVVLAIALLAHEAILETYGPLLGLSTRWGPSPIGRSEGSLRAGLVRFVLLVGGVLWALSSLALAVVYGYPVGSGGFWFGLLVQGEFIAAVAILAAISPRMLVGWASTDGPGFRVGRRAARAGIGIVGVTLLAWLPPAWVGTGASGLVNQIFGALTLPAAWGAVAPPTTGPVALALRWGLGYAFLGTFALTLALAPRRWAHLLGASEAGPSLRSEIAPAPSDRGREMPTAE
ncbi:MAG: hypothetical protein QXG65_00405 [Thermoplasmata archaeon]